MLRGFWVYHVGEVESMLCCVVGLPNVKPFLRTHPPPPAFILINQNRKAESAKLG